MSVHRAGRGRHRAGVPFHRRAAHFVSRDRAGRDSTGPARPDLTPLADRAPAPGNRRGRRAGVVSGFAGAAVLSAAAAWAIITAIATGSGDVGTATLSLTQTGNGAGLTTSISNMLPGDTQNRYVDVANAGTADGASLTLAMTGAPATRLTTDATHGLQLTVTACSSAWNPGTGACTGTTDVLLSSTPATSMGTAQTLLASTFAAGTTQHLRVSLTLPTSSTETTVNGTTPPNSIQGLNTTLSYTFTMAQRAGTTTNS